MEKFDIQGEKIPLTESVGNRPRILTFTYPYVFAKTIRVFDETGKELVKGVHYNCRGFISWYSEALGENICGEIAIVDTAVVNQVTVNYVAFPSNALLLTDDFIEKLKVAQWKNRKANASDILNMPREWAPDAHTHRISDFYYWGDINDELGRLAIGSGLAQSYMYLNKIKAYKERSNRLVDAVQEVNKLIDKHMQNYDDPHETKLANLYGDDGQKYDKLPTYPIANSAEINSGADNRLVTLEQVIETVNARMYAPLAAHTNLMGNAHNVTPDDIDTLGKNATDNLFTKYLSKLGITFSVDSHKVFGEDVQTVIQQIGNSLTVDDLVQQSGLLPTDVLGSGFHNSDYMLMSSDANTLTWAYIPDVVAAYDKLRRNYTWDLFDVGYPTADDRYITTDEDALNYVNERMATVDKTKRPQILFVNHTIITDGYYVPMSESGLATESGKPVIVESNHTVKTGKVNEKVDLARLGADGLYHWYDEIDISSARNVIEMRRMGAFTQLLQPGKYYYLLVGGGQHGAVYIDKTDEGFVDVIPGGNSGDIKAGSFLLSEPTLVTLLYENHSDVSELKWKRAPRDSTSLILTDKKYHMVLGEESSHYTVLDYTLPNGEEGQRPYHATENHTGIRLMYPGKAGGSIGGGTYMPDGTNNSGDVVEVPASWNGGVPKEFKDTPAGMHCFQSRTGLEFRNYMLRELGTRDYILNRFGIDVDAMPTSTPPEKMASKNPYAGSMVWQGSGGSGVGNVQLENAGPGFTCRRLMGTYMWAHGNGWGAGTGGGNNVYPNNAFAKAVREEITPKTEVSFKQVGVSTELLQPGRYEYLLIGGGSRGATYTESPIGGKIVEPFVDLIPGGGSGDVLAGAFVLDKPMYVSIIYKNVNTPLVGMFERAPMDATSICITDPAASGMLGSEDTNYNVIANTVPVTTEGLEAKWMHNNAQDFYGDVVAHTNTYCGTPGTWYMKKAGADRSKNEDKYFMYAPIDVSDPNYNAKLGMASVENTDAPSYKNCFYGRHGMTIRDYLAKEIGLSRLKDVFGIDIDANVSQIAGLYRGFEKVDWTGLNIGAGGPGIGVAQVHVKPSMTCDRLQRIGDEYLECNGKGWGAGASGGGTYPDNAFGRIVRSASSEANSVTLKRYGVTTELLGKGTYQYLLIGGGSRGSKYVDGPIYTDTYVDLIPGGGSGDVLTGMFTIDKPTLVSIIYRNDDTPITGMFAKAPMNATSLVLTDVDKRDKLGQEDSGYRVVASTLPVSMEGFGPQWARGGLKNGMDYWCNSNAVSGTPGGSYHRINSPTPGSGDVVDYSPMGATEAVLDSLGKCNEAMKGQDTYANCFYSRKGMTITQYLDTNIGRDRLRDVFGIDLSKTTSPKSNILFAPVPYGDSWLWLGAGGPGIGVIENEKDPGFTCRRLVSKTVYQSGKGWGAGAGAGQGFPNNAFGKAVRVKGDPIDKLSFKFKGSRTEYLREGVYEYLIIGGGSRGAKYVMGRPQVTPDFTDMIAGGSSGDVLCGTLTLKEPTLVTIFYANSEDNSITDFTRAPRDATSIILTKPDQLDNIGKESSNYSVYTSTDQVTTRGLTAGWISAPRINGTGSFFVSTNDVAGTPGGGWYINADDPNNTKLVTIEPRLDGLCNELYKNHPVYKNNFNARRNLTVSAYLRNNIGEDRLREVYGIDLSVAKSPATNGYISASGNTGRWVGAGGDGVGTYNDATVGCSRLPDIPLSDQLPKQSQGWGSGAVGSGDWPNNAFGMLTRLPYAAKTTFDYIGKEGNSTELLAEGTYQYLLIGGGSRGANQVRADGSWGDIRPGGSSGDVKVGTLTLTKPTLVTFLYENSETSTSELFSRAPRGASSIILTELSNQSKLGTEASNYVVYDHTQPVTVTDLHARLWNEGKFVAQPNSDGASCGGGWMYAGEGTPLYDDKGGNIISIAPTNNGASNDAYNGTAIAANAFVTRNGKTITAYLEETIGKDRLRDVYGIDLDANGAGKAGENRYLYQNGAGRWVGAGAGGVGTYANTVESVNEDGFDRVNLCGTGYGAGAGGCATWPNNAFNKIVPVK